MRFLSKLCVLLSCAFLIGCGSQPSYKYKIAVIPKGLTHEHWQSVHRGAEKAASDLAAQGIRVKILWDGPRKENEADEQNGLIRSKRSMGIHGLALAPQHSKLMIPQVDATVKKGIPVVLLDSNLDADALKENPKLRIKYVATNNYNGGRLAAEKLLKLLNKDGKTGPKLILFRYAPGSESTGQREKGFLDYVNEQIKAGKKITILSENEYAGATVETAEKKASPLLTRLADKGIDGIFASNESATTGMLNALNSKKLTPRPRIVGFDSSVTLQQAIREGTLDGTVIQDPFRMGYLSVWILVQHLEGYDVSKGGYDLSTGEHFLTKENLDSPEMRNLFIKEEQLKRKIKVPTYEKK